MHHYPASMLKLIRNLARLPGIGEKTAERLALHILKGSSREAEALALAIIAVKEKIRLCSACFGLSDDNMCAICSNPARDKSLVCVVENMAGMVAVEKAGVFTGLYHILQGVLSPLNGVGPDDIRIRELIHRVAAGGITEIILATSTHLEGEATAAYIAERLRPYPVTVSRIATGIPSGGDLNYVDPITIQRAVEGRHAFR